MAKSPEQIRKEIIANLKEKIGRTQEECQELLRAKGLTKHGEMMKFLKGELGVSHGYANQIALAAIGRTMPGSDDLVEVQYSGAKAGLRPIYERLIELVRGFGSDVEIAPKLAYVSLRRSKQFAILQPSTATRLDVGIQLKGVAPTARLEASGSFNAMVSHRVRLTSAKEIDSELKRWLKQAYDAA
jgi:hypothetical protein